MVAGRLDVGGAVVFWSVADTTDRRRLVNALLPLGLESYAPLPRPAPAAPRDALEQTLGGPRVLVRPLAGRDGFAVVREDRGSSGNRYATELVARVVGDPPALEFDSDDGRAA